MAHEVDLDKAIRFVEAHGSAAEHARLRFVLSGARAPVETTDALFAGQRADGGFAPFWAPAISSVDATCFMLAQLEQMGAASARDGRIVQALNFFARRQARDGSIEEDDGVRPVAPVWASPGQPAAQIYLTANAGFWLALRDPLTGPANAAGRFLHNQLQKGDALASYVHANWLAAGLWHRLGWMKPFDYAAAYLMRNLETLDSGNLAWLGVTLLLADVTPAHTLYARTVEGLAALQEQDGRWCSADGPRQDAHVTIEAIRVITRA